MGEVGIEDGIVNVDVLGLRNEAVMIDSDYYIMGKAVAVFLFFSPSILH